MDQQDYTRWIGSIAYGQYEDAAVAMEKYIAFLRKQDNYQLHINIGERYATRIKSIATATERILGNLPDQNKEIKVPVKTRNGENKELTPASILSSEYVLLYRFYRLLGEWKETLVWAEKALSVSRSQEALNTYVSAQLRMIDPEGLFGKGKKSDKRPRDTSELVNMMIESIKMDPFSPEGIESGLLLTRDLDKVVSAAEL